MPPVSGSARILSRSLPTITAAACSSIPPAAPDVTSPASAPVWRAINSPACSLSSLRSTIDPLAASIASAATGSIMLPPRVVLVPWPLMIGLTP